jgi:hypothetical protein
MALIVLFLSLPLLNITDLSFYAYRRMQVENSAQMGAQQAWTNCNTAAKFASGCSGLTTSVMNAAIQSTTLGTAVTEASLPTEAYYCTTAAGALSQVATYSASQALCSTYTPPSGATWSDPTAKAGGYVKVSVSYSFTSVYSGVTVVSLLPSPITKTTYTRVL